MRNTRQLAAPSFTKLRRSCLSAHLVLLFLILYCWIGIESAEAFFSVTGVLSSVLFGYMFWLEATRSELILTPLSFFYQANATSLGIAALVFGFTSLSDGYSTFGYVLVPERYIVAGYVLYHIGTFCLHLGLQLFRPPLSNHWRQNSKVPLAPAVTLWGAGTLFAALDLRGSFGLIGSLVATAPLAGACLLFLRPPRWVSANVGLAIFPATVLIAGVMYAHMRTGLKGAMMLTFYPLIWAMLVRPKRRKWLPVVGLALIVFLSAVVLPVVSTLRLRGSLEDRTSVRAMASTGRELLMETSSDSDSPSGTLEAVKTYVLRVFQAVPAGYFMQRVDNGGLAWTSTYAYLLDALIPRLLWPNKPVNTRAAELTVAIGVAESEGSAESGTAWTPVGELYFAFGYPGVMIGMFILGGAISLLTWRLAGADPRNSALAMLAYVACNSLTVTEGGAGDTLVTIIGFWIILRGLIAFEDHRHRRRSGASFVPSLRKSQIRSVVRTTPPNHSAAPAAGM